MPFIYDVMVSISDDCLLHVEFGNNELEHGLHDRICFRLVLQYHLLQISFLFGLWISRGLGHFVYRIWLDEVRSNQYDY